MSTWRTGIIDAVETRIKRTPEFAKWLFEFRDSIKNGEYTEDEVLFVGDKFMMRFASRGSEVTKSLVDLHGAKFVFHMNQHHKTQ